MVPLRLADVWRRTIKNKNPFPPRISSERAVAQHFLSQRSVAWILCVSLFIAFCMVFLLQVCLMGFGQVSRRQLVNGIGEIEFMKRRRQEKLFKIDSRRGGGKVKYLSSQCQLLWIRLRGEVFGKWKKRGSEVPSQWILKNRVVYLANSVFSCNSLKEKNSWWKQLFFLTFISFSEFSIFFQYFFLIKICT